MRGQLSRADVDRIVAQLVDEGLATYAVAHWIAGKRWRLPATVEISGAASDELVLEVW